MSLKEQQIKTAQVAFVIVDHIGAPPSGSNFRAFTTLAIEEHLELHPCYYQRRTNNGPKSRTPVTPFWMRRLLSNLHRKANRSFYEPHVPGDDIADTLLRKRSTAGFPAKVLATYRYERATFSESDLPANEEPLDEKSLDSEAIEISEAQIGEGGKQKADEHDGVNSRRRRKAAKSSKIAKKRFSSPVVRNSEEPSEEAEHESGGGDGDFDNEKDDNTYLDDHGGIDRAGKDSNEVSSEIVADVIEDGIKTVAKANQDASRKKVKQVLIQSRRRLSQASAMAKPPKRKRTNAGGADRASSEDEFVNKPKICSASNTAASREGTPKRPSNISPVDASIALPPSESRSDRPAPSFSPITPRVEKDNAQVVAYGAKGLQSSRDDTSGSNIGHPHQQAHTAVHKPARNNKQLYIKLGRVTDHIIGSIGRINPMLSSLDKSPSNRLEALYKRCWGPDWRAVKSELLEEQLFVVHEVTMSIIAAFLFDNVFNQQASFEEIEAKQLELKGMAGVAILAALDLENKERDFAERVRAIEIRHARELLAKTPTSIAGILRREAQKFTKELWGIIKPHFRSLSTLAKSYDVSTNLNEPAWQKVFEDNITELIEAALYYRITLLASGDDHVYTWPAPDDPFNELEMEIDGAKMKSQVLKVMFTVFPGTKAAIPDSTDMVIENGTMATVKVGKVLREIRQPQ